MSEAVATTATTAPAPATAATATAAPTQGAATQTPAPAVGEQTASVPSDLVAAVAAHRAQLDSRMNKPKSAANDNAAGEDAASATANDNGTATVRTVEAEPAAAAEPAKVEPAKEAPKEDEVAANISKYLRQARRAEERERAAKAAQERAAQEQAAAKAEREQLAKDRAKEQELTELAKTDAAAAIRRLVGDKRLSEETVLIDLLQGLQEQQQEPKQPQQLTPDQVVELAAAKLEAKIKAEREEAIRKQEADAKTRNERGKEAFFSGLAVELQNSAGKYPYLEADGVDVPVVDEWIAGEFHRTGQVPQPARIFEHFNEIQRQRAERFLAVHQRVSGATAAKPAPVPVAAAITATPTAVDTRGKPGRAPAQETYAQRVARIARELDAADRARQ